MELGLSEALVLLAVSLITLLYFTRKKRDPRYPPGYATFLTNSPTPLPLIGNVHQIGRDPLLAFQKWAQKYGPIYSIKMGSDDTVVISNPNMVKELFSEQVSVGRLKNPVFTACNGERGIVITDGPTWEEQRRFATRKLRDMGLLKSSVESKILEEVKTLLQVFERNVGKPMSDSGMFNGAVVNTLWSIVSGERHEWDAPEQSGILKGADDIVRGLNRATTTGLLFAPSLRHIIPKLSGWTYWMTCITNFKKLMEVTVSNHIANHDPNNLQNFMDHYIAEIKKEKNPTSSFYKETGAENLFATLIDLFLAGSETSSSALNWAMLQLSQDQGTQRKLQGELDRVLGTGTGFRLPSLDDKPSLPYTEAVIMEVLRLFPGLPLSLPHKMQADMEFQGHFLPNGTDVISNIYAIHHDKNIWGDDAEMFRPERFLSEDGTKAIRHEALIPFGVGRRKCIGESLATNTVFLFIASICHKFDIEPDPNCVVADMKPVVGLILKPKPFKIVVKLRGKSKINMSD